MTDRRLSGLCQKIAEHGPVLSAADLRCLMHARPIGKGRYIRKTQLLSNITTLFPKKSLLCLVITLTYTHTRIDFDIFWHKCY